MKSIISGAFVATAIVACLSLNVQAKSPVRVHTAAVSDTGKMEEQNEDGQNEKEKNGQNEDGQEKNVKRHW